MSLIVFPILPQVIIHLEDLYEALWNSLSETLSLKPMERKHQKQKSNLEIVGWESQVRSLIKAVQSLCLLGLVQFSTMPLID